MTQTLTRAQAITAIVADAIRELGEVPSGELYAHLMGVLNIEQYNGIIAVLKQSGLVSESRHMLTWNGKKAHLG